MTSAPDFPSTSALMVSAEVALQERIVSAEVALQEWDLRGPLEL